MKKITWLLSIPLLIVSCVKYKKPITYDISGTYRFEQVIYSTVGNYTEATNLLYKDGAVFINPNEFPGLDTIRTTISLVNIQKGQIQFNALITPIDTLWGQSYQSQNSCILSNENPYFSFYPFGMKRVWKLIDYSDSTLVVSASTQWPQANAGPGFNTTYRLKKLP
jgi:hypothetical protein